MIEKYGGIVGSSVTAKTNVVIQGYDEETSRKLQQAKEKGIPITNQEGLFDFISNSGKPQVEQQPDLSEMKEYPEIPQITEYISHRQKLQSKILNYLDNSENYQTLQQEIEEQKITENKINLNDILHLTTKICNNHYHFPNFF